MTRYFMTIPEAVQLIIRSGALACAPRPGAPEVSLDGHGPDGRHRESAQGDGTDADWGDGHAPLVAPAGADIYVLEMGEPVSILELAREMIGLSGLDPDRDIEIEIVGRRPGEKLHEELFNSYERRRPTAAEKILLAEREPLGGAQVEAMFAEIGLLVLEGDAAGLAAKVSQLSADRLGAQTGRVRAGARRRDGWRDGSRDAPAPLIHSPD